MCAGGKREKTAGTARPVAGLCAASRPRLMARLLVVLPVGEEDTLYRTPHPAVQLRTLDSGQQKLLGNVRNEATPYPGERTVIPQEMKLVRICRGHCC